MEYILYERHLILDLQEYTLKERRRAVKRDSRQRSIVGPINRNRIKDRHTAVLM